MSLGDAACKLVMWLPMFTIMCSIFTMVAISFDRYFTIVRQRKLGRVGLTVTILGIWLLSVAGSSPQFYEYSIYEHFEEKDNETEISCGSHGIAENFETIYASIVVFVAYFIPLIFIIYNYINLARFLWKVSAGGDGIQGTVSKKKVKIVKMLALVTAVFAICWAPFFILFTMEEVTGTDDTKNITSTSHSTKESFIAISTISNPILYLVLNDRFRSGAFRLITCGHYRGSAVENASVTLTRTAQSNS